MKRGEPMKDGDYHLVVHICIFNTDGKMLIQQRQPFKDGWSNLWDITVGGSYMNASLFPSEVADIISGVVIYLCAFALLFKSGILKTFFSGKKQKPAESGKEAEA